MYVLSIQNITSTPSPNCFSYTTIRFIKLTNKALFFVFDLLLFKDLADKVNNRKKTDLNKQGNSIKSMLNTGKTCSTVECYIRCYVFPNGMYLILVCPLKFQRLRGSNQRVSQTIARIFYNNHQRIKLFKFEISLLLLFHLLFDIIFRY